MTVIHAATWVRSARPSFVTPHLLPTIRTGDSAFHRFLFHWDRRHTVVTYSNRFAYFGLTLLVLALADPSTSDRVTTNTVPWSSPPDGDRDG